MPEIGVFEAKTKLSELLDRVSKGERFVITRHGTPVAELGPIAGRSKRDVPEVIERLRELRRGVTTGGVSIRDMIEEGRRL